MPFSHADIGNNLFHYEIRRDELLSERTVPRFADPGHVLAKVHLAEAMCGGNYQILRNLSGTMTDRAAVMKKFKSDFKGAVQATLGTGESIEFLCCNAHFLLGLSSKTNSACKSIQAERGELLLSRDLEQEFRSLKTTEAAVVRYIRMACEVFCPRGDETNSCQNCWVAYCSLSETDSIVSSFNSNRFNNIFEATPALHYHMTDIITFLQEYLAEKTPNSRVSSSTLSVTSWLHMPLSWFFFFSFESQAHIGTSWGLAFIILVFMSMWWKWKLCYKNGHRMQLPCLILFCLLCSVVMV